MAPSPPTSPSLPPANATPNLPDETRPSDTAEPPSLEVLLSYLVAAKRTLLSSTDPVWRANEIVNISRAAVEESVVISSRTTFLRNRLNEQLRLLYGIRSQVETVGGRGQDEFNKVLKDLDSSDDLLRQIIDTLRATPVDPGFRPKDESLKSLHDFIDPSGMEDLRSLLKNAIDNTTGAQAELAKSNSEFENDLRSIRRALGRYHKLVKAVSESSPVSSSSLSGSNTSGPSPSIILDLYRTLESTARIIARNLEALVRNYDMCAAAVRHTEGGGAAVGSIAGDLPPGIQLGVDAAAASPFDPANDEDYQNLVNVILKDAPEAEYVVVEIQDRIAEMEATLTRLLEQRDILSSVYTSTTAIYSHLSDVASSVLPNYIRQANTFTQTWKDERSRIEDGMQELLVLRDLYLGFLEAYDRLILEVRRRKNVRRSADRVLADARAKLDKLYEEDLQARMRFRAEQGDYIPSDIWPGLGREPSKIEFTRVPGSSFDDQDNTQKGDGSGEDSIPDLPKDVIEVAKVRYKERVVARQSSST